MSPSSSMFSRRLSAPPPHKVKYLIPSIAALCVALGCALEEHVQPCSLGYPLPLPPSHPLRTRGQENYGDLPTLPKTEREAMVLGSSFCCKLPEEGGVGRGPQEQSHPPSPCLGRKKLSEEEKDHLFLHPQWDW